MSDEHFRPTLTFPKGAYNASQVRLYGIVPKQGNGADKGDGADNERIRGVSIIYPQELQSITALTGGLTVKMTVSSGDVDNDGSLNAEAKKLLIENNFIGGVNDAETFKTLVDKSNLLLDNLQIILHSQVLIETKKLGAVSLSASISLKQAVAERKAISCGIIVAYAFEGHTYDLPKPKIMIIPALPEDRIPKDDSGFDAKEPEGYAVWLVDKLDECVEFEMNQGFVDQIVLEANLPGKRAPNMYAGRMMLGHRSGRLTE